MASPKITIQFQGKGGGALKKTLEDLHLANVRLTKGQKAFVKEQVEKGEQVPFDMFGVYIANKTKITNK